MDITQYLAHVAIGQQHDGLTAFSALPDAPVLPVVPTRRDRFRAALDAWRTGTVAGRAENPARETLAAC